jgi:hypothetical protein
VSDGALRVALLHPTPVPEMRELEAGLVARGHAVALVTSRHGRVSRAAEDRLERSGFQRHLTHIPFAAAALCSGRFDLAHAFFLTDAAVAARWSARTGRPVLFSCQELPDRATLASKRRRLALVREATRAAALVVSSEAAAEACRRWLGVAPEVVDPRDAAAHEDLYRRLLA